MTSGSSDNRSIPAELLQELDDRVGAAMVIFSVLFFIAVYSIFFWLSKTVTSLRPLSERRCLNLAVSWLHACISTYGCGYSYFMYGQYLDNLGDLVDFRPYPSYLFVAFSFAYFIYDMVEHKWHGAVLESWEVMAHHVAVLTTFGYNLWYQTCIAYAEVALLTEVNSVFLHARKLMQMFRVPFSHWLYRIIVVVNLITFVVFRGLALSLIVVGVIKYTHKISTFYVFGLASSMTIMILINPVLFWRLVKSDVLRAFNKRTSKGHQKEAGNDKRDLTAVNGVNVHAMLNDHVRMTSQNQGSRRRNKIA